MNIRYFILNMLCISISSCSSDWENCTSINKYPLQTKSENSIVTVEVGYPNVKKELITLNNGMTVEKIDSIYIFQGDIILTQEQINIFNNQNQRSAITTSVVKRWPKRTVYYTFAPDFEYQSLVNEAIEEWESKTSLKFLPKTQYISNYIEFYHGEGNNSQIGCCGGKQQISLAKGGANKGTAIHEIGHAVGLFHEQTRTDRDNFVRINWDNIRQNARHNYNIYTESYEGINIGTFDFNSVMLYSSFDFAINPAIPTMERLDGSTFIGQRSILGLGDIEGVRSSYGPPFTSHHIETDIIKDEHGLTYESFESTSDNVIYFYADEAYTIRTALQYPRHIQIILYTNSMQGTVTSKSEILLPAGTTEYSLNRTECLLETEWGNKVRYYETYYVVR